MKYRKRLKIEPGLYPKIMRQYPAISYSTPTVFLIGWMIVKIIFNSNNQQKELKLF